MNFKSFLKLVEIQTKVASVIPYLLGTIYALYRFDNFNFTEALLLFSGMLIFDMTTTAINNYMDYTRAIKKEGYGYEVHNALGRDKLEPTKVLYVILSMLMISILIGIVLFIKTDITVLIVGVICFIIGILYSFGPIPISRTPFGEIFSGLTMGLLITFLAVYVHIYDENIASFIINGQVVILSLDIKELLQIIIVSIPAITGIANIMLANNICDIEEDIVNKRYTLPIYIGKEKALAVFKWLYYIGYIAIVIGVAMKALPLASLLVLITLVIVNKNIKAFYSLQSKKDTFILAVQNFVLINITYILTILVCILV